MNMIEERTIYSFNITNFLSTKQIQRPTSLILFLIYIFTATCNFAQDENKSLKILFVGNSYTHVNSLPQIISFVSENVKTKLVTKESTAGGAKLREHWLGERGLQTKDKIKNGNFDIVVLQGHSMSTILEPDSLTKYVKLFSNYIKENGAKPYLYLTWAREKIPQYQKTIDSVYYSIASQTNTTIVPVGRAWQLAKELRSDIKLFEIDGSHPSKFGTILSAYTFVATITHEIPNEPKRGFSTEDLNGEYVFLMYFYGNEISDLVFLKKIVETVVLKN